LLTFLTQVRTFILSFPWIASNFENSEDIKDPGPDPNTVSPSERAISEEMDRAASLQTLEGSTEYHVMFSAINASEIEVAGLEHEHITELQQLLSKTLAVQTEQDRRLAQLTEELALKSALLEQAETNAAETRRSAELERRENTERLLVQTSLVKQKDAELGRLQAKYETDVAEVRAEPEAKKLKLEVVYSRPMDAENSWTKSRAEAEAGSLQDQVTLWRNKYEALAKLYSEIRTEHFDLLSTSKQSELKASAQTAAGESVHGSRTSRVVVPRAKQMQRQDHPRIKLLYGEVSMRFLPSCTASYVRSTLIHSQRANSWNSRRAPRLQQVSSMWMRNESCLGLWNA
jgi:hypothetical protein